MTESAPTPNSGGMSPESILNGTGTSWDQWLKILDDTKATAWNHAQIAKYLLDNFEVSGWWAQGIAIGYEYERGMREPGMTSDGFAANASKTLNLPVEKVWKFFGDDELRAQWLEPDLLLKTSATEPKTFNAKWLADDSRISVNFTAKGENKSSFGIQHRRLPEQGQIAVMKAFWKDRISTLVELSKQLEE
ncbi:hypothetical protein [Corynebacterium crudilactis]|uniref:DUF4287 domain-containing protein n=1 Tax=Corynebacterium crudilactis TaxID=1652495 RepID=A0A172QTM9_9CORY|nr:hypothetical protein [Corynebacterium crudilactis]ANE04034.1 hypothetical protein ccrud_07320 [Corynebacterium crudilactis]